MMSDKKISDLVELTTLAADDVLPVVDADANATKRVTYDTLATEVRTESEPLSATTVTASGDVSAPTATIAGDVTSNGETVYHRGNVVGTVSESGGDVTGAVIERDENANGEYVKFADGTLICWVNSRQTTFSNSSNLEFIWTYPQPFVAAPNVEATCNLDAFSSTFRNIKPIVYARNITLNAARIGFASAGEFSSGYEDLGDDINGLAIGRWY